MPTKELFREYITSPDRDRMSFRDWLAARNQNI